MTTTIPSRVARACRRACAVLFGLLSAVLVVPVGGLLPTGAFPGPGAPRPAAAFTGPAPVSASPTAAPTDPPAPTPCADCPTGSPIPSVEPTGDPPSTPDTSAPPTSAPAAAPSGTGPARRPSAHRHAPRHTRPVQPQAPAYSPVPPADPLTDPLPPGPAARDAGRGVPRLGAAVPVVHDGFGALNGVIPVHRVSPRLLTWTGLGVLAISIFGMLIVGRRRRSW